MRRVYAVLFALVSAASAADRYLIETIAGGAPPSATRGTDAYLVLPVSLAADTDGNVYFGASNAVFRVTRDGTMTRIAGNGRPGYSGDGGPATAAQYFPTLSPGLTVDRTGNVYIADRGAIRRVAPSGTITTIAGTGVAGYSGDGGPATVARVGFPYGLALDFAGNLYFADGYRIRKVSREGIVTTIAGTGSPGFSGDGGPAKQAQINSAGGLAIDRDGNLLFADIVNGRVRKIDGDGIITTVAGGGSDTGDGAPATTARLAGPIGIALDAQANLWIAETSSSRIVRVSPDGVLHVAAGGRGATNSGDGVAATTAFVPLPRAIATNPLGEVFFQDGVRVRAIGVDGTVRTIAGGGAPAAAAAAATAAQFGNSMGVTADRDGNTYVADGAGNRVWKVSPDGRIAAFAGTGAAGFSGDGGPALQAALRSPSLVAADTKGNVYIGDVGNSRIRKVAPDGTISTFAGTGKQGFAGDGGPALEASLNGIFGLTADGQGNIALIEGLAPRVRRISPNGTIRTIAGTGVHGFSGDNGPAAEAQLNSPQSLAADAQGNLYVADANNDRVRRISTDGVITTVAGIGRPMFSGDGGPATTAGLYNPSGVAVDAQGDLFIADTGNLRIRRVAADGSIATVAGNGMQGYSGDGGPALRAQLADPYRLSADGMGNLYIFDIAASSVRRLKPAADSVLVSAVVDAASQGGGPLSPGKIVVIYGDGLGPTALAVNSPAAGAYSTSYAGTTVWFDDVAAPILYASSAQVAAVVPYGIAGPTAQVSVGYAGARSRPFPVAIAATAPSLFTLNQTGGGAAAAVNIADGTINTALTPARAGDYIALFATGEGQTSPAGVDGRVAAPSALATPVQRVSATVGGLPAEVQYAGAAPGLVSGLMQVNVRIPAGAPAGGYIPVVLKVGEAATAQDGVWISVADR